MEKMAPPGGGGPKLCSLDMQSYLEVMGRQLAEMQAQHQQFCASRPERNGRVAALRNQEYSQRASSVGSGSSGTPRQQAAHTPLEAQDLLEAGGMQDTPAGEHTSASPSQYRVGTRSASTSGGHPGARRSLVFFDSPAAESVPDEEAITADRSGFRSSSSTPLPGRIGMADEGYNQATDMEATPASVLDSRGRARSAQHSLWSQSQAHLADLSVSPSSASFLPHGSNPVTPSVSTSTQLTGANTPHAAASAGVARPGTASASERSARGPYRVYDASGAVSSSYGTPDTDDVDQPLMASVRSSTQAGPRASWHRAPPGVSASSPRGRQAAAYPDETPSTGSVQSGPLAIHEESGGEGDGAPSEGEGSPYPLALAGQAYDGIDSEEDEEPPEASSAEPSQRGSRYPHPASSSRADHAGPTHPHGGGNGSKRGLSTPVDPRPQSRPPSRAPLQAASFETEEALRALLASTRFPHGIRASVGASIDTEGTDVPDDVLAALASTNPPNLDALLGAATASLREQLYARTQAHSPRGASHGGGERAAPLPSSANRHTALGPGGLTAAPAAVSVARGVSAKLGATSMHAVPNAGSAHKPDAAQRKPRTQSVVEASASLEADDIDALSRTLEVHADGAGLLGMDLRASAASSAAAMAMQLAAAQAHAQPVLYGRAALHAPAPISGGGARHTNEDGEQPIDSPQVAVTAKPQGLAVPASRPATPDTGAEGASPAATPRGRGNSPAPSVASSRRGGDGDMVLYGSPRRNNSASNSAPQKSAAASPYVPPSPPPGADPTPYMASPTVAYLGSRLQHSSRDLDGAAYGSFEADVGPGADSRGDQGSGVREGASFAGGVGEASISSRRLFAKARSSGTTSGSASVSFDLSLTQAAAATGNAGRPVSGLAQLPTTASVSTSAGSLQRMPTPVLEVHRQQDASPQPMYSTFSVAGMGSAAPRPSEAATRGAELDERRRPTSPSVATAASALASAAAPAAKAGQPPPPKQPPAAPPLAAFSRAAALAAAADVGLKAPLPHAAVGRRESSAPAAAAAASTDVTAALGHGQTEVHEDATPWDDGQVLANSTRRRVPHGNAAGGHLRHPGDGAPRDGHMHGHVGQPVPAQSPAPPSASSSVAKLNQLKARRQQQWQSQHGIGEAEDIPGSTSNAAAPPGQGQRHGSSPRVHAQQEPDAHYDHPAGVDVRESYERSGAGRSPAWAEGAAGQQAPREAASAAERGRSSAGNAPALLPGSVAQAIALAAQGGMQLSASGELNLGHGISGLSVAIEAGQVKWAWQTGAKGSPRPGHGDGDAHGDGAASPGASSSSPWASPVAGQRETTDAGQEWGQLPAPQWQPQGPPPAGGRMRAQQERADLPGGKAQLQHNSSYNVHRRHSEYSLPTGQAGAAQSADEPSAAPQHQYAASAGGAGQQPQQLRGVVSADVAGKATNKALALMRLKRQSIMRHAALVGSKEMEGQQGDQEPEQQQAPPAQRQQPMPRAANAQRAASQQEQQRLGTAARAQPVPPYAVEAGADPSRSHEQLRAVSEAGSAEGEAPQPVQPKPFLRRRSAKVEAKKVDWSHVKSRTNTRNADYYGDRTSPRGRDAIFRQYSSPITSPNGGAAKPPLNVNNGRAWKPGGKLPLTPTEEEKAAAAVAAKRRGSNIPAAPGYAAGYQAARGVAEENRAPGAQRAGGSARGPGGAISPLDDLLAHVNTLLRDFDKIVL